jgi:hypothetical protein
MSNCTTENCAPMEQRNLKKEVKLRRKHFNIVQQVKGNMRV